MADNTTLDKPATEESARSEHTRNCRCYRPNVDILERADELVVLADVPGAKPDAIDVKFEDGILSVHAPAEPRPNEHRQYLLSEYGVGDYRRSFRLGEAIDPSKIAADYADGVLTLHLPKTEATKPRKIEVQTG